MAHESLNRVFAVTVVLGAVCSLLIASAVVGLRDRQKANSVQDMKKNILIAAGLYDANVPIDEAFGAVQSRIVDLQTGDYVPREEIDPDTFDQRSAARDPDMSVSIEREKDVAGIGRREKYSFVYLIEKDEKLDQVILPVYGKGLWGTMYTFLALDADLETIAGITFYEHIETPGLGAEIDNPAWRASWVGKKLYRDDGTVGVRVVKGTVDASSPNAAYEVDGISGATLTVNGVTDLLKYWCGEHGFRNYLKRLKERGATDG